MSPGQGARDEDKTKHKKILKITPEPGLLFRVRRHASRAPEACGGGSDQNQPGQYCGDEAFPCAGIKAIESM